LDNLWGPGWSILSAFDLSITDEVSHIMAAMMISEHSMNETILATPGDPVGLTVSIAPWPFAEHLEHTDMPGVESRAERARQTLTLWSARERLALEPLRQLRHLMETVLPLLRAVDGAKVTLTHAAIVLDAVQLATALDEWTDDSIPVHSLVAFDFAVRGDPPGTKSIGLAALVGQEVIAWPPDETLRLPCARMVVRLAHDMLLHGPILTERIFPAPDAPRGTVTLVPRDVPTPVVQIRF
jgi:hypothetical protein